MVFKSDKFVLTKGGVYVGKGYLFDGFFKANVAVVDKKKFVYLYPKLINKENSFHRTPLCSQRYELDKDGSISLNGI